MTAFYLNLSLYNFCTNPQGKGSGCWSCLEEQQACSNVGLQPSGDIQFLDDYRQRHALYRTDPGLQALTASAPLLAIWDDHEFVNNVRFSIAGVEFQVPEAYLQ